MVTREKALRLLWTDTCSVICREQQTDPLTRLTDFVEVTVAEDVPCRLSFAALAAAGRGNTAPIAQSVKLFLSKDVDIPAGSKIVVQRGDQTLCYAQSGPPGIFTHHQEIPLEEWRRWA